MTLGGRLHEPRLRAIAETSPTTIELRAPMPGHFIPAIDHGDLVTPDEVIGQLVVLGRSIALTAPAVRGLAVVDAGPRAVAYGDRLLVLDLQATIGSNEVVTAPGAALATSEFVFRAPTSGRFYNRSAPDKPAFVTAGIELAAGATVCLLEVMKTFHRVTYGGEPVRVSAVLVADGDDVSAGDPLLALEPM